jgi:hypothetical protein
LVSKSAFLYLKIPIGHPFESLETGWKHTNSGYEVLGHLQGVHGGVNKNKATQMIIKQKTSSCRCRRFEPWPERLVWGVVPVTLRALLEREPYRNIKPREVDVGAKFS